MSQIGTTSAAFYFQSSSKYFYLLLFHNTCEKNIIKQYREILCIFIFTSDVRYIKMMWNWKLTKYQQSMTYAPAPVHITSLSVVLTQDIYL